MKLTIRDAIKDSFWIGLYILVYFGWLFGKYWSMLILVILGSHYAITINQPELATILPFLLLCYVIGEMWIKNLAIFDKPLEELEKRFDYAYKDFVKKYKSNSFWNIKKGGKK